MSRQWIITQIGAREHYAVARALHRRGELDSLYTDAWCRTGRSLLQKTAGPLRSLAGRYHPEVPPGRVVSFTLQSLCAEALRSRRPHGSTEEQFHQHAQIGRAFALRVNRHLRRLKLDPARHAYFGYDTGCLETLELLRDTGVPSVVDQIDPGRTEEEMVFQESQKWPGWEAVPGRIPDLYYERLAREWELATRVLVNSPWSRDALIKQGVPAEKLIVVPLAFEPHGEVQPRAPHDRPLKLLWLGSVILRKGIQYLIEAAKLIEGEPVEVVVAGPIGISEKAVASAPKNVRFIGRVNRDRAAEFYRDADAFVLPTISDGFAITQLEAMAHGLPVIATPHCGEVVTHGVDGLIVPAFDAAALAAAIADLGRDRARLAEMSRRAVEKSKLFTLERFADALDDALEVRG